LAHKKNRSEAQAAGLAKHAPSSGLSQMSVQSKSSSYLTKSQPVTPTGLIRKKSVEDKQPAKTTKTRNNSVYSITNGKKVSTSGRDETTPKTVEVLDEAASEMAPTSQVLIVQLQNLQSQLNQKNQELIAKDAIIVRLRKQVDQVM
jgi:hypothetical protein